MPHTASLPVTYATYKNVYEIIKNQTLRHPSINQLRQIIIKILKRLICLCSWFGTPHKHMGDWRHNSIHL